MSLSADSSVGSRTSLHVKFDKYLESSIKSGEWIRRAGGVECVDPNEKSAEIQIPKILEKFWTSPANKTRMFSRVDPSQTKGLCLHNFCVQTV